MVGVVGTEIRQPFRPRARMLQLLGDELIASDRLAVFELVKNAYDADASSVSVRLNLTRAKGPTITVSDDGEGMPLDAIRFVWLVPGNDHRKQQRLSQQRTPRYNRLPLGEKGVGRFAVHKLGNRIRLVTRSKDSDEYVVRIDWNELIAQPYLDEAPVTINVRRPRVFTGDKTGTQIRISQLRTDWGRGEVRRLHNQITSICSPFEEAGSFSAVLEVPGHSSWIDDLPDISMILDRALWRFSFELDGRSFSWKYAFRPVPGINMEEREVSRDSDTLQLTKRGRRSAGGKNPDVADESITRGIGPVRGELYIYDRDKEVIRLMTQTQMLGSYLDQHGGVRVYRDGIRVYDYGEPGDDWLGLDLRRVNAPTHRISRNLILGAVHLSLEQSTDLVEKTNREGFVENNAFQRLQQIVLSVLAVLEGERHGDKEKVRQILGDPSTPVSGGFERRVAELRAALRREDLLGKMGRHVDRIEREYQNFQETLLSAGMSGLNLAVIFHEVDRGVRLLHRAIVERDDPDSAALQAEELVRILEGFSGLLRRGGKRRRSALDLVRHIQRLNSLRFRYHRIRFVCPMLDGNEEGFRSRFELSLVLGAINNLIDNSIHWLKVRWPDEPPRNAPPQRMIYLGISRDLSRDPALVVADNGTGLRDSPEHMVHPFFTRKPDGMGLGLFYSNLAMELNGGQLIFPQPGEVEVPDGFDGAVVALTFKETK